MVVSYNSEAFGVKHIGTPWKRSPWAIHISHFFLGRNPRDPAISLL